jgi:hypothetical protein
MAHERGFECSHVNHLGKMGEKDWELKKTILEGDWTFVTNNSVDFRGPFDRPGATGQYADVRLHAGLVCINASGGLNLETQKQLFALILNDFEKNGDLINQVMEVDLNKAWEVGIRRCSLPAEG